MISLFDGVLIYTNGFYPQYPLMGKIPKSQKRGDEILCYHDGSVIAHDLASAVYTAPTIRDGFILKVRIVQVVFMD
jgi:hypothetical protein